ncbi:MAG: FAD:protein FMN transferase [Chloroflexi bacterium]|nr:FAD:protein FMN transferase [Chloroflexota bacterium]
MTLPPVHLTRFRAMGCAVEVRLSPADERLDAAEVLRGLSALVEDWEEELSRFRSTSGLMQLNARAGAWTPVSETLFEVISCARHAGWLTGGLYNPLILPALIAQGYDRDFAQIAQAGAAASTSAAINTPSWETIELRTTHREVRIPEGAALDLGGIAKGWAADRIANTLAPYGACLVNLGGDIAVHGAPNDQPGWAVHIGDPLHDQPFATVYLRSGSIVTSGADYRRWRVQDGTWRHHIIDPRTGGSANSDVLSVTVIHADGALAEAYAKAALLLGSNAGLRWLDNQWATPGLVIRTDGAVVATEAMQIRLSQPPAPAPTF